MLMLLWREKELWIWGWEIKSYGKMFVLMFRIGLSRFLVKGVNVSYRIIGNVK